MASFQGNRSLTDFQRFIKDVYGLPDERYYSIWDLLTQTQRFAMRALKGIRKDDQAKIRLNLLISISWVMAIANRLHIDAEDETWRRFPGRCSYCGAAPCACAKIRPSKRKHLPENPRQKPKTIAGFQKLFERIYPSSRRTLAEAGVHLAEETGEVSESIHNFLGEHREKQFEKVKQEIADFMSCAFGVANSAGIDVAAELARMFPRNCHVCHQAPCICTFSQVASIRT